MKTITKQVNIYEFEELKKEIQDKLIEEERENQKDIYCEDCLSDDMKLKAIELLKKYFNNKATFKNVYYDLSYCQGSGAMIEFNLTYYNKPVEIKHNGFYYNERSFSINSYELTEKQEKQLKNKIIKINEDLVKAGYSYIEYFYEMPDFEIINILSNFNYLENGKINY